MTAYDLRIVDDEVWIEWGTTSFPLRKIAEVTKNGSDLDFTLDNAKVKTLTTWGFQKFHDDLQFRLKKLRAEEIS